LIWVVNQLRRSEMFCRWEVRAQAGVSAVRRRASSFALHTENRLIEALVAVAMVVPGKSGRRRARVRRGLEERAQGWREMSTQKRWEKLFFRPIEGFNTIWLVSRTCFLNKSGHVVDLSAIVQSDGSNSPS
jgi:hypothetical protein